MDVAFLSSILVSAFSLALVLIGIPAQIAKNYREKRSGLPLLTILIAIGFYASLIAFFIATAAYVPLISFSIGMAMWGVVFVQYVLYRRNVDLDSSASN